MNTHTRSMHYDDHDIIMIMFIIICLVVIIIIALELCGNCVCVFSDRSTTVPQPLECGYLSLYLIMIRTFDE